MSIKARASEEQVIAIKRVAKSLMMEKENVRCSAVN